MAREKRAPINRTLPTDQPSDDQPSDAALQGRPGAPSPAPKYDPSGIPPPPRRQAAQPSQWVIKACLACGRDWRELIAEYGSEEQKYWVNGFNQQNFNEAIMAIMANHECPEGEEEWKKREERANERAAKRFAEEEKALMREEQVKKDRKRRSSRVKEQGEDGEEIKEESDDEY